MLFNEGRFFDGAVRHGAAALAKHKEDQVLEEMKELLMHEQLNEMTAERSEYMSEVIENAIEEKMELDTIDQLSATLSLSLPEFDEYLRIGEEPPFVD